MYNGTRLCIETQIPAAIAVGNSAWIHRGEIYVLFWGRCHGQCNHACLIRGCEFIRASECSTCHLAFFTPKLMHYLFRKRFFCDIGNICWRLSMQIGSQCEIWSLTSHVKSKGVLVFPAILSSSEVNFPFVKRSSYDDVNTSCGPWFHDAFRELSTRGGPVTKVFGVQWIFYIL